MVAPMHSLDFSNRELRPIRSLLTYYLFFSFVAGPAFPIVFLVLFFKYRSLRYELDEEGISMRWGILFRREIHLSYDRLQDIHLHSNAIERHLGLARVKLQTASGSSRAEITVEGVEQFEQLRDFLYSRMRGAAGTPSIQGSGDDEAVRLLRECVSELRALRRDLTPPRDPRADVPPAPEATS